VSINDGFESVKPTDWYLKFVGMEKLYTRMDHLPAVVITNHLNQWVTLLDAPAAISYPLASKG
jgi:hypothetical protein